MKTGFKKRNANRAAPALRKGQKAAELAVAEPKAEFAMPVELFKWVVTVFLGFLFFIGSSYDKTYYRVFGVADYVDNSDLTQIAINSVTLLLRPAIGLPMVVYILAAVIAIRKANERWRAIVFALAIAIGFGLSGELGRAQARVDAKALLSGKSGRVVWCSPHPDKFDPGMIDDFILETQEHKFRLLFERNGYLFLANADSSAALQGNNDNAAGQALIIRRDDLTVCRVGMLP